MQASRSRLPALVLASASPRRREILDALGILYEVVEPGVEEVGEGEPEAAVLESARRKARAGLERAGGDALALGARPKITARLDTAQDTSPDRHPRACAWLCHALHPRAAPDSVLDRPNRAFISGRALGVDTEVVLDGRMLGKPADAREARERLEALSGRAHEVLSGVVLVERRGADVRERAGVERSLVRFRKLDAGTLDLYLASGEWRDRAGAYAIQGLGSLLVEGVEGDFSNVVGLPVRLLLRLAPELLLDKARQGPAERQP